MNEKKFSSFYKLNDEEINKLKEKVSVDNIRNSAPVNPAPEQIISPAPVKSVRNQSAPKSKIVAVAVSVAVVVFGVMIGIKVMPDRNSGNNNTFSEPEPITTEKITTTTKKTESEKAKTTAIKTESATEKITEPVNNETEDIKIDMNRHYCTHCDIIYYTDATEEDNLYNSEWGIPFSLRNIYVDENEMLIGLFEEDFDLSNVEKTTDNHVDGLKDTIDNDFYFFDYTSTRYTIKDLPSNIEGIPEEVMPDYIVIDYSPDGDCAIGHRYCTRVHFCFNDKPIGYNFEFVKGKDLLEDEMKSLKEHIKEYGLTQ